ncbi:putative Transcriptional adapter 2-alpha [Paratrimastix pyriformis]|uniref:Transcriptional adapter 2-alpha n=1 Tax=Paratrimastix pyriformis TaxID=342808 RepID=A0ABQ8UWW6_9EUKA|nr:putative Transcriptional adapter 2-alpha [Paratrimastix pyriformis]
MADQSWALEAPPYQDGDEEDTRGLAYQAACAEYQVFPVSVYLRNLDESTLSLAHHALGPRGMQALAKGLSVNPQVTTLSLVDCWVGREGVQAIAQYLRAPGCALVSLDLTQNGLAGCGDALGELIVADTSRMTRSLHTLNLSHNRMRDSDLVKMARHMANMRIQCLNLSHNEFEERGAIELAAALPKTALRQLNLGWNHVTGASKEIVTALQGTSSLTHLSLEENGLQPRAALDLAAMLAANHLPLTSLNLGHCLADQAVLKALFDGLPSNRTLSELVLAQCPVTAPELLQTIVGKVPQCVALRTLDMRGCFVTEAGMQAAAELAQKCSRINLITNTEDDEPF